MVLTHFCTSWGQRYHVPFCSKSSLQGCSCKNKISQDWDGVYFQKLGPLSWGPLAVTSGPWALPYQLQRAWGMETGKNPGQAYYVMCNNERWLSLTQRSCTSRAPIKLKRQICQLSYMEKYSSIFSSLFLVHETLLIFNAAMAHGKSVIKALIYNSPPWYRIVPGKRFASQHH